MWIIASLHGITHMHKNFVVIAIVLNLLFDATHVYATDVGSVDVFALSLEELMQIDVTSYRESVVRSRDLKRLAVGTQDSIVAEDIADFPDLNLAESLQRIPGITITREGGEGRQVTVRGLNPNFTRVQLNGMEVLARSASTFDSRDDTAVTRGFDFNVFSSDLFSQVDVQKSYSASQDEGGIAATVNLRTPKPFDKTGFRSTLNLKAGENEYTDDHKPQFSGLVSNTWGSFGALAAIAYSTRDTVEQGYSTTRWRPQTTTNIGSGIDADTAALLAGGVDGDPSTAADNLWFARNNRYSYWANTQERIGVTTALQFRPISELSFDLDMLYGTFKNDKHESHIATGGSGSTALGTVNDLEYINNNGDLEAIYGEFSNVNIRTESRDDEHDTDFYHLVLNGAWDVDGDVKVTGLIGRSKSDFSAPVSDKVYLEHRGGITTDFRQDRFYGVNSYDFDTADISQWTVRELDFKEDHSVGEFTNAESNIRFALDEASGIALGVSLKKFTNDVMQRLDDDYVRVQAPPLNAGVVSPVDDIADVFGDHEKLDWVAGDVDAAKDFYGLDGELGSDRINEGLTFGLEEYTKGAFFEYDWKALWLQQALRGDAGIRYYETYATSTGLSNATDIRKSNRYTDLLPTINLAWDIRKDAVWRVSLSQDIARPNLLDLSASAIVRNDVNGPSGLSIQSGNPDLEPLKANNVDTSIEWYFGDIGYVAVAAFYKDIENFVVDETVTVPYGQTGYPLSLLGAGQDANTLYVYSRPVNSDTAVFKGLEVSYHRDLDFLPSPFNYFGVITNYTLARGKARYQNVQASGIDQTKNFVGLSENSANFTLYYEKPLWGARVSATYRDNYISKVEGGLADEDERGFHATTFWDLSAFYKINEAFKVTLEGVNLSNEREEQYSDSSDRLYSTTTSGTSYFLGAHYKF